MSNKKNVPVNDGYSPSEKKGYQPQPARPSGDPKPQSGYVPTSEGDNPSNKPKPPTGD